MLIPFSGSLKGGGLHGLIGKDRKVARDRGGSGEFEESNSRLNDTGVAVNTS